MEYIPCCIAPVEHWGLLLASMLASRKILIEQNIKRRTGPATEYTECWPCPLFDILSNKYYPPANLLAGRKPQWTAGAVQQGMYSTIHIHWNIKSAPASPGRSRVRPALYVFRLLRGQLSVYLASWATTCTVHMYSMYTKIFT